MAKKKKKKGKMFLVLKVIGLESGSTNSLNLENNTCHRHSMCYEAPLRFKITLRQIFFKSGSLRVMRKYDESAPMKILQGFGTL